MLLLGMRSAKTRLQQANLIYRRSVLPACGQNCKICYIKKWGHVDAITTIYLCHNGTYYFDGDIENNVDYKLTHILLAAFLIRSFLYHSQSYPKTLCEDRVQFKKGKEKRKRSLSWLTFSRNVEFRNIKSNVPRFKTSHCSKEPLKTIISFVQK